MTRKEFLAATLSLMVAPPVLGASPKKAKNAPAVPRRKLGRTGQEVSCIGLGGFHIGKQKEEAESIALIRGALDQGINFLDNCWDYNDGKSEERMGKALRDGYRAKAFLMTKIDGRDKKTAAKQIDESLQRLQTDHLDLLQLHEVIRDSDPDRAFAEGGAIEAMKDAQKAGKARFLGFTGHKSPDIHLKMLETAKKHGFRFDTVQMPLNVMDAHFNSFEKRVLPVLVKEGIGVLAMKSMGDPFILDSKTVTAPECLRYNLSLPVSVVITGIDSQERLQQALTAARTFKPLSEKDVQALLARTKDAAQDGAYEKYKTSHHFDGTVQNPQWLG
ncbi:MULTISPECIES: aldo/keto reductase [unclassified Corallococcus]|uniref:aldo/keto reductase n=1 Tax=unclassified Corallococcus TaxID=2685029 RepID=UPI001A8CE3F5|nr:MULTISPECIES: aldo/keto reductase [unclassified Corallococcus]MBN9684905.1 aldo/keto reductase [Corallococcus sp. NCSPR001]WAS83632.1 aldo/keto reductase [Corallococcus sp. NCRR]